MTSRSRIAAAQGVVLLLCFLSSLLSVGVQAKRAHPMHLTLYVHEDRRPGAPTATLITVLTLSGNLSQVCFGSIQIFSNTFREGADNNSAMLGVEPGFVTFGKQNVYIGWVYMLSTPSYKGTLCIQGQIGPEEVVRELAIVGGTDAFRFASGYDVSSTVNSDLADYTIIHKIYLKYFKIADYVTGCT